MTGTPATIPPVLAPEAILARHFHDLWQTRPGTGLGRDRGEYVLWHAVERGCGPSWRLHGALELPCRRAGLAPQ